ncbi:UNVERIFIED_CONTAM: hypothetical protein FKN15_043356 [Acipenser sinensis]
MPASGSGARAVEFWVEGSRRDTALEDFYTKGPELGRCEEKQTQKPYAAKILKKTYCMLAPCCPDSIACLLHAALTPVSPTCLCQQIRLKEIFETATEISLVLELVTGGELFDRIVQRGYYSERDAAHVIKQILEAVAVRLCGFEPFFDPRGDQYMYSRILSCDYEFISPWWDEVSLNAKDLVCKLIVLDPQRRLSVQQALQHPWVSGKAARFSHMDTTQRKLQEFNARRKLKQAAMKAVVATSRIGFHSHHEGSRGNRQPESTGRQTDGQAAKNSPEHASAHCSSESKLLPINTPSTPAPQPPQGSPKTREPNALLEPPTSISRATGNNPEPPSASPDHSKHPQPSAAPKTAIVWPLTPKKCCSLGSPNKLPDVSPSPPSPKNIHNGFVMESHNKKAHCQ